MTTRRLPSTRALQGAIKGALRVPGRVAGRSRADGTATGWRGLAVRDGRGHELRGVERVVCLAQWRDTGVCDAWFDYTGADHEDPSDARTWGPRTPHDVDWRGFPPLMFDRYAALP